MHWWTCLGLNMVHVKDKLIGHKSNNRTPLGFRLERPFLTITLHPTCIALRWWVHMKANLCNSFRLIWTRVEVQSPDAYQLGFRSERPFLTITLYPTCMALRWWVHMKANLCSSFRLIWTRVEVRSPDAYQQALPQMLAPDWGPGNARPGEGN